MNRWSGIAAAIVVMAAGWYLMTTSHPVIEKVAFAQVADRAMQTETASLLMHEHWGTMRVLIKQPNLMRAERDNGEVQIFDKKTGRLIMLNPMTKEAVVRKTDSWMAFDIYGWLRRLRDSKQRDLGEKELDGRKVIGFEVTAPIPATNGEKSTQFAVWVDPKTSLPVQIESVGGNFPKPVLCSDIRFGVALDDKLFDTSVPEGYKEVVEPSDTQSAPGPAPQIDPSLLKVYAVGKKVSAFPDAEDFSTPENAFATITRKAMIVGTNDAWRKVSTKSVASIFPPDKSGEYKMDAKLTQMWLDAKIVEVRLFRGNRAGVIAELHDPPGKVSYSLRSVALEDGKWLNEGEDRPDTLEQARAKFDSVCQSRLVPPLDPSVLKVYAVGKKVSEFPDREDFSTPETAFATITRKAMIVATNDAWRKVSAKEIAEQISAGSKSTYQLTPEQVQAWLDTRIVEVRIFRNERACIISEHPVKPGKTLIDLRSVKLENGKWLNIGQDAFPTLDQARAKFNTVCKGMLDKGEKKK